MAYEKITWYDSPDTSTPLNAENLNRLEDGVEAANNAASANAGDIDKLEKRMDTAESNINTAETNIATLSSDKEDVSNKTTSLDLEDGEEIDTSDIDTYPTAAAVQAYVANKIAEAQLDETEVDISGKEDKSNKVNAISMPSSIQYPTLAAVINYVTDKYSLLYTDIMEATGLDVGVSVVFDENYLPLSIISTTNFKAQYLNGGKYVYVSNKVLMFTGTINSNITDIYINRPKDEVSSASSDDDVLFFQCTVSDSTTIHYNDGDDWHNFDWFLLEAIYNLYNKLKVDEITDDNSTSTYYFPSNNAITTYLDDNYYDKDTSSSLFGLGVSAVFDEDCIPLNVTSNYILKSGSLNYGSTGVYIFISKNVTAIQSGAFSSYATDIYIDRPESEVVFTASEQNSGDLLILDTIPSSATVHYRDDLCNVDEFLLRAIYDLNNSLSSTNSKKVDEITDDNSTSTNYFPSNKAVADYVDTAITNFENTWDFESLCNDVDNLSSNIDGLESNINTLTSKVESTNNMIYFKRGTTSWDEDIYIYYWNAAPSNFSNRYQANPSNNGANMGFKMTLIDEENGIYAYPRLNYTHMRFACTKVTDAEDLYYTTSDMLVPLPTQEKMPCYYQSSIGYDGIWGDLANDNVRIYLQSLTNSIPTVTADSGNLTVYPIGCTGNSMSGRTSYYYYVDVPADSEDVLTITIDGISTESSVFESCYNHTVFYCTGSEYIGYFNGDLDEFFRELIGYDNSKLS